MNRVRLAGNASLLVVLAVSGCANSPSDGVSDANPADESAPPSVELAAEPDSEGGWNVHARTNGFRFAPEHAGDAAADGEGHAHLYVDGEKVARLYGPWYYLDADEVPAGEHTLSIELNGNDHSPVEQNGEPVSDEVTISSSGETHQHQHEHEHDDMDAAEPEPEPEPDASAEIRIADGKVSPPPDQIELRTGDQVRLTIESDVADTIHVHGIDVEQSVEPGKPAVLDFQVDQTGRFEVETHESGLLLTQLLVE